MRRAARIDNTAKTHKYGAKRTTVDGITFSSKAEARRYSELKMLEKAGEIRRLVLQPRFPLWAHGCAEDKPCAPVPIGVYVADFAYERSQDATIPLEWAEVVEDVKGFKTALYRWKKKHVEAQYGIEITEVR